MVEEVIVTPVVEEQLEQTVEVEATEEAVAPQPDAGKRRKARKSKKKSKKAKKAKKAKKGKKKAAKKISKGPKI